ncbi:MAG TPA: nodulation protein NfeD, partial [Daejeonella sp.]|nr:nodulation protein NfeD [Daejeonella sp.]
MKRYYLYFFIWIFLSPIAHAQTVLSLSIEGSINPASAAFIHNGIEKAHQEKAQCLIIRLNTPGGLLESTRAIVSDILQSPVPVIVYVAPPGAHAGSAGVFVTLAADIAAMAPGTNIGAAHPVSLQGPMDTVMNGKATNDAAAFIRTIAQKRKRNFTWAEEAVRKSLSITENEALEQHVIDLVASNDQDLLHKIDGKTIQLSSGQVTLHTKNAVINTYEMSYTESILNLISDPNIAYIMLLIGIYGILFELFNPGAILPGIAGVIALILAFYSMHALPVNYAGLALIVFGIILFLLEIKIVSHGLLAVGGVISLTLGSFMLIRSGSSLEVVRISTSVIISAAVVSTLFFL